MLESIESKIHNMLLDLDPTSNDLKEQSIIVAEAAENYRLAQNNGKLVKASKSIEDALLIDCLLDAMSSLTTQPETNKYACVDYLASNSDGEIAYEDVMKNLRFSSKNFGASEFIDDDLIPFLENQTADDSLYKIEDIFDKERPNSDLYTNKIKKHRRDQVR